MKEITLPINTKVTFNEEAHTYTLSDGTQLSGITSIIHKYLFPCMYDGVSESVMQAARDRGHEIHKALEEYFFSKVHYRTPECAAVEDILSANNLHPVAAEYLVSSVLQLVATCIDLVAQRGDEIVLIDHKTTSALYTEYLQWQLSIEAELFEAQTGMKVNTLCAVHIPKNGDVKLVEIKRLPTEYIEALFKAYANGDLLFENPLHKMSEDTNELLKQYREAELSLIELNASVDYYKQIQADIKAKIKEQMDEESASKWENDEVTITRSKDSVRKTFKVDMLKEKAPATVRKWLDKNIDKCYAETSVAGNVTIKFK